MKIAFIFQIFPTIVQTKPLNIITGLINAGHKVDIFYYKLGQTEIMHSDIQRYGLLKEAVYLGTLPAMLINLILSLGLKGKRPYDIIHCQTGFAGLRFLPLHKLRIFGGKLIVHFRGDDITELVKRKGDSVYRNLFQDVNYILTVCDYFKKRAIELGCPRDKISVNRSGIDCKRFAFLEKKKPVKFPVRIVFVGKLVEKKGVEYAIRALQILIKRDYNVEFDIVGNGELMNELKMLSKKLHMEEHIKFLGAKNYDGVVEILKTAHLFVAPSLTASAGNQEGIPNVLKEAMAVGLPVVSTYHAGIPELIEDGVSGFLVQERDYHALADKIAYLIDRPKLWSKMGRNGRKVVEKNYDKEKLNKELVEIYKRLIDSRMYDKI